MALNQFFTLYGFTFFKLGQYLSLTIVVAYLTFDIGFTIRNAGRPAENPLYDSYRGFTFSGDSR